MYVTTVRGRRYENTLIRKFNGRKFPELRYYDIATFTLLIQEVNSGVGGAKKSFDVTSVDPSEYEPQVVELSDQLIQDTPTPDEADEPINGGRRKESPLEGNRGGVDGRSLSSDSGKDEDGSDKNATSSLSNKNARWLSKLQKLRQQFNAPPTD